MGDTFSIYSGVSLSLLSSLDDGEFIRATDGEGNIGRAFRGDQPRGELTCKNGLLAVDDGQALTLSAEARVAAILASALKENGENPIAETAEWQAFSQLASKHAPDFVGGLSNLTSPHPIEYDLGNLPSPLSVGCDFGLKLLETVR